MKRLLVLSMSLLLMVSCNVNNNKSGVTKVDNTKTQNNKKVLTAEEQSKLTPDKVIEILKRGNEAFANNNLTVNNSIERVQDAVQGQFRKP